MHFHVVMSSVHLAFGLMDAPRGRNVVEIEGCPMELSSKRSRYGSWKVLLKPDAAGLRILTLDGYVLYRKRFDRMLYS